MSGKEATPVEIAQRALVVIANEVAQTKHYSLGDQFCRKEVARVLDNCIGQMKWEEIMSLDEASLRSLGFRKWDDKSDLLLIPLWLYDLVPNGTTLTSISGGKFVKGLAEIDLDVRFGCIAFGIILQKQG